MHRASAKDALRDAQPESPAISYSCSRSEILPTLSISRSDQRDALGGWPAWMPTPLWTSEASAARRSIRHLSHEVERPPVQIGILARCLRPSSPLAEVQEQKPTERSLELVPALLGVGRDLPTRLSRTWSGVCSAVRRTSGLGAVVAFRLSAWHIFLPEKLPAHPKICP